MDDDDSISFEMPWDESCQSCGGEWEPIFPPAGEPDATPDVPGFEFMPLGFAEEASESADVPEPVTWMLIGAGLTALSLWGEKAEYKPAVNS